MRASVGKLLPAFGTVAVGVGVFPWAMYVDGVGVLLGPPVGWVGVGLVMLQQFELFGLLIHESILLFSAQYFVPLVAVTQERLSLGPPHESLSVQPTYPHE